MAQSLTQGVGWGKGIGKGGEEVPFNLFLLLRNIVRVLQYDAAAISLYQKHEYQANPQQLK
jgi:hypothetical protein